MSFNHLRTSFLKGTVLLLAILFGSATYATAQTAVKGRITDPDGQPVVGATVQNLTEKTFTTTDADGNYTLNVKDLKNALLEVGFLGMETVTEALNGRARFDVQMAQDQMFSKGR